MKIDFLKIAIQGFRSFEATQRFTFPTHPGFYFITGENKQQPTLGSNASGKSTMWEALCWVLYGQTSRGVKASNIANWKGEYLTSVLLTFTINDKQYNLLRSWNPNALSLTEIGKDPYTITQEELTAFIGIDFDGFLNVVLLSQFGEFFFDLSATDKLAVFAKALSLDFWLQRSDNARQIVKKAEEERNRLAQVSSTLSGRAKALAERLSSIDGRRLQFDRDREADTKIVTAQLEISSRRSDEFDKQFGQTNKRLGICNAEFDRLEQLFISASKNHRTSEKAFERLSTDLRYARKAYQSKQEELRQAELTTRCPTCDQFIDNSTMVQRLTLGLKEVERTFEECGRLESEAKKAVDTTAKELTTLNEQLRSIETEKENLSEEIRILKTNCKVNQTELDNLTRKLTQLKDAANPWEAELKTINTDLSKAKRDLFNTASQLAETDTTIANHSFWTKGFKELRLWLIEKAILELEVHVNSSLVSLGLPDWNITFDVERENATGGVTKGFDVLIQSPNNHKRVPWKSWSGGETQRLRIAGAIGLMNLISNRLGVFFNLEVWDEPTAHMNEGGIDTLLTFLQRRAIDSEKVVFLVDHRSYNFGGFSGSLHIVKDEKGSRFNCEVIR